MCGIAGIIYRNGDGAHRVGRDMTRMLQSMKHRGPGLDRATRSTAPPTHDLVLRAQARRGGRPARHRRAAAAPTARSRRRLRAAGAQILAIEEINPYTISRHARLRAATSSGSPTASSRCRSVEVLSLGHALEIIKDLGDATTVGASYHLDDYFGSHGIGHVRMATESDVDISNAHPYWAYPFSDVAVVHNGQLTNYHQWRRRLERGGTPLRVGVRLGDHRRLHRRADGAGRLARGSRCAAASTSSTASSPTSA